MIRETKRGGNFSYENLPLSRMYIWFTSRHYYKHVPGVITKFIIYPMPFTKNIKLWTSDFFCIFVNFFQTYHFPFFLLLKNRGSHLLMSAVRHQILLLVQEEINYYWSIVYFLCLIWSWHWQYKINKNKFLIIYFSVYNLRQFTPFSVFCFSKDVFLNLNCGLHLELWIFGRGWLCLFWV